MGVLSNEACSIRTFLVESADHRLLMSVLRQEQGHCMIAFKDPTFHPTDQTNFIGPIQRHRTSLLSTSDECG
jgi:hypothetical protein